MESIVVSSLGVFHTGMKFLEENETYTSVTAYQNIEKLISDEVLESSILRYLPHEEVRRIDKISKLLLISGLSCVENLGGIALSEHKEDLGIVANTVFGSMSSSEEFINSALSKGIKNASPIIFPFTVPNAATGTLTAKLGINGFNTTISGYNPIGYSFDLLKLKRAKGLFVSAFDEITERIRAVSIPENLFYYGDYSEGAITFFITTDSFAKENNIPKLFEILAFESSYNQNDKFTFDNSEDIEDETITYTTMELLKNYPFVKRRISLVISAFPSWSKEAKVEENILKSLLGESIEFDYPKDIMGETFSNNNFGNVIYAFSKILMNPNCDLILVNSYDVGGHFSSVVLSK